MQTRKLGNTGVQATTVGFGGAPIGKEIPDDQDELGVEIVRRAYDMGIRYFDTAPIYGMGRSERRIGLALADVPRDEFVVSTKVGRLLRPAEGDSGPSELQQVFDFSRDGVMRSLEESLQRLNLDHVEVAHLHGPQDHYEWAISEAYPALADLRSQGVVNAIGAGMNQWEMPARFAREADFDCFLVAGRYTLLDQTALPELLPLCLEKGISIVMGGPYNSGILASDLSEEATYQYEQAPPDKLDHARKIKVVCDRYDVPLKAAALQFGLAHPAVATTIPGMLSTSEVEENVRMAAFPIPSALWGDLKDQGLIVKESPTPG